MSFEGRSSSASFFHVSLLQAIDGVMPLALCPACSVPSLSTLQSFREASHFNCDGCFARQFICSVIALQSGMCQTSTPTGVFEGGCLPSTHSSLGFPFHFFIFVASSFACLWQSVSPPKLQALVYDILPSTTAVFSYAMGSRKLSANEQFSIGAQTVVSLLQTTQIKQGVLFIAANKVYTSTYKTKIV